MQQGTISGTAQQKIEDLLQARQDQDVSGWIAARDKKTESAQNVPNGAVSANGVALKLIIWEARTRSRIQTVIRAIPRIPAEIGKALLRLRADAIDSGSTPMIAFSLLVASGIVVEWLFRRKWWRHAGGVEHYLPITIFAAIMTVLFFAIAWPPSVRLVVACHLTAFVVYRLIAAGIGHTAHPEFHGRLKLVIGLLLMVAASTTACAVLGMDRTVLDAVVFLVSCIVLMLALELVWSKTVWRTAAKATLSVYLAVLWLLWCLDIKELFWLGLYIVALPPALRAIAHTVRESAATHFLIPASDSRNILLVRGSRAIIIGLALGWIALIWELDAASFAHDDPRAGAVFYGLVKSIVVLLLADLIWHLAKAAIDRNITPVPLPAPIGAEADGTGQEAHATRLHTLLPILRNVLAVALFIIAGLVILGQLGIDIGPLIAGAGIFGVALGFGSQALVRDVISGIFYLFDDAFRVGEYIQAKNYTGTVEGFSLRSVKLRHHRGPIFTVPFGELGAVENMSRDWSKVKFVVTVPYDTDIEKARKIGKTIGQALLEDPELGPLFIQPLKMKGVEEFGEYGIVISFAMVTVPTSQQSFIRRTAYAMLHDAFQKNGIVFAQPTVQVGGETAPWAAAAALRYHQDHGGGIGN
ncbi:mechanosensitive ion channel [Rhizobium sp. DBTS2]|uniref:Mechanosensitive ion channel n=2 Tax=Mycoplana rhizolycopersici TaxID=2746702 RepID=A0ABX2QKJ9_9HYPH|nr:mechanosensitive ion channel domain-containing protein [Rhizobium rhizolycopersici]NVP58326.1 mechanosensitive ion channel [Rhizobium rhizolycopersici]